MECQDILWRSWYHPTILRLTNALTLTPLIWEVQLRIVDFNIFGSNNITIHNLYHHVVFSSPDFPASINIQPRSGLMLSVKVCLNPSFNLLHDQLPADIHHSLFLTGSSLCTYTLLTCSPSPTLPFTPITYITAHHTRNLYFFLIWCLNAAITFKTNSYQKQYHLQVHSATSLLLCFSRQYRT